MFMYRLIFFNNKIQPLNHIIIFFKKQSTFKNKFMLIMNSTSIA